MRNWCGGRRGIVSGILVLFLCYFLYRHVNILRDFARTYIFIFAIFAIDGGRLNEPLRRPF